jgi:hypothetical protein
MGDELKRVADLIKEHKEAEARAVLIQILKTNPTNDDAWVWMASITEDREKRQKCLEEALKNNPRNQTAQKILDKMTSPIETMPSKIQPQKISALTHILCGWPLILAIFGGAIGGAFGGAAYWINLTVYKSSMPSALKIVLNPIIGILAIGLWLVIGTLVTQAIHR